MKLDLDELERIAKAATPKWAAFRRESGPYEEWEIRQPGGGTLLRSTSYGNMTEDAEYVGVLNPATALELIRLARLGRDAQERLGPAGVKVLQMAKWAETHRTEIEFALGMVGSTLCEQALAALPKE